MTFKRIWLLWLCSAALLVGCGTTAGLVFSSPSPPQKETNGFVDTAVEPVSTFSLDVDTGSYTLTRRHLIEGKLPPKENVRAEEFLNYFRYATPVDAPPTSEEHPLSVYLEASPSPFGEGMSLVRIGVKALEFSPEQRKPVNLVFLIDVSGSMYSSDKLGLVKYSLGQLVKKLEPSDTLGIVTYAGADTVLLEPTPVDNKAAVLEAIERLSSGGSTGGEAGIRRAYALAEKAKRADGVNRVVLCTDGDFNVGARGEELYKLIESFREKGIFLTTLGFGMGNYQDKQLEQLADRGNGNYGYIDTPNEAVRMLGENLVGTLQVVAKDVKVQVAFEPSEVKFYRLIGYENRRLENKDFTNDQVDAGDVGAGHHVIALYEVELVPEATGVKLAEVRIRFKQPAGTESIEEKTDLARSSLRSDLSASSADHRFVAAVAEFGEILAGSSQSEGNRFEEISRLVSESGSATPGGDRAELLELVEKARALSR